MSRTFFLLFTIFWLLGVCKMYTQDFEKYTVEHGLSINEVLKIAQDEQGFIYAATYNGLNVFDGSQFKQYNTANTPSLSNDIVSILPVNPNITLFGSQENGLYGLNKEFDEVVPIKLKTENGLVVLPIKSLHKDDTGRIWIGTDYKGLYSFHVDSLHSQDLRKTIYCNKYSDFLNFSISDICSTSDTIWLGTLRNGIFGITKDSKNNKTAFRPEIKLSSHNIWSLKVYHDTLFAGTENGLNLINLKTGHTKYLLQKPKDPEYSTNIIRAITRDRNGDIWVGCQEDGVYRLTFSSNDVAIKHYNSTPFNSSSLNTNKIISLYADVYDNIWIGTWNGGLNKYSAHSQTFKIIRNYNKANILSENMVKCVTRKDKDSYWVGTYGSGICTYKSTEEAFTETINLTKNNSVSSLYKDNERNLLLAGSWGHGLKIYQTPSLKEVYTHLLDHTALKNDRIYSIIKDSHGIYWIGSITHGLFSLNLNEGENALKHIDLFKTINKPQETKAEIRQIILDEKPNSLLIVKHNYGIFEATTDDKGNIIKVSDLGSKINFKALLSFSFLRCVFTDYNGNSYIGTDNGLVLRKKGSNSYSTILTGENLNIWDITQDDDQNIWIATYSGLIRYSPNLENYKRYFPSTIFMKLYYDKEYQKIIAASHSGIYEFDPRKISSDPYHPEIFFDHLQTQYTAVNPGDSIKGIPILQKHINYTNQLTLPYFLNTISLDINTLSYSSPNKNSILYQLKGLETMWHKEVDANIRINYRNIPPGNYTLQVKAANKDNTWNPNVRKINVTILPPWWKTKWAYFTYILILLILIYFFMLNLKHRTAIIQKQKFDAISKEKDKELNEQKLSFFTNISHDLRTPLTLILAPLEDILNNEETGSWLHKQHTVMHKNATLLLRLVNQILDFRKVENKMLTLSPTRIDIILFIRNLFSQFESAARLKNVDMIIKECNETVEIWGDKDQLERVIINIVSNALKHTAPGGYIEAELCQKDDDSILIKVRDNGIGIDPEDLPNIFKRFYQSRYSKSGGTGIGLALAQKIIELHKGSISAQSEKGQGTTFIIQIPVGRENFINSKETDVCEHKDALELDALQSTVLNTKQQNTSHNETILVVDDNEDIREYLNDNLSNDYKVYLAQNGTEGVQKAKQMLPSLIICDIMMEDLEGTEVCEILKNDINTSHIPIILLTSKTSEENIIEGFEKGADDYIHKPFSLKLLKTRAQNLIHQRAQLRSKYGMLEFEASAPQAPDEEFLTCIIKYIEENISNKDLSVEDIAKSVGMTHDQYYRKIKNLTGLTANKFHRKIKLRKANNLLRSGKYNVSEVLYMVGFSSPSYFTKCFKEEYGKSPTEFLQ